MTIGDGMKERIIWGIIAAVLLIIVTLSDSIVLNIAYIVLMVLAISEIWHLLYRCEKSKILNQTKKVATFIVLSIFVALCFFCIVLLRHKDNTGPIVVWLAFIGAFSTDTFAYIFGMWLGQKRKHFIFPKISPKKTLEGAIGGIVGTTIIFLLWGIIGNHIFDTSYAYLDFDFNLVSLTILGFLCGFVAQAGDLLASALKRKFGVKDFGSILPGHGGILDRCDSLMLVAPFVLLFISLFSVVISN